MIDFYLMANIGFSVFRDQGLSLIRIQYVEIESIGIKKAAQKAALCCGDCWIRTSDPLRVRQML